MIAAVGDRLVCARAGAEITARFDEPPPDPEGLIALFARGVAARSLAGATGLGAQDASALLDALEEHHVISSDGALADLPGVPLIDAILSARRGGPQPSLVWTQDELLALPERLAPRTFRRVIRAFVSGLPDVLRVDAYAHAATAGTCTVCGDEPEGRALDQGIELVARRAPCAITVVDLRSHAITSVTEDEFHDLGGRRPHRLGPLLALGPQARRSRTARDRCVWTARYALPNLRYHDRQNPNWAHGCGPSDERAELIARAEAIERYAAGDLTGRELVRARADELEAPVLPPEQVALSDRQYRDYQEIDPYTAEAEYLWVRAAPAYPPAAPTRWVTATSVFLPFFDPQRERHLPTASSSGLAAHTSFEEARDRALRELIERDAFMWTWVQRVSRERIDPATLPTSAKQRTRALERAGSKVDFVNLSLDVAPVVLCAVHDERSLHIGASCRAHAAEAALKALDEATILRDLAGSQPAKPLGERDVERPGDHHRFYMAADRVAFASFLFASPDRLDLREVATPFDEPLHERVSSVGQPLVVDLSSRTTAPFRVVRALVPGLIPISFGWDREPLGVRRLAEPKRAPSGQLLGRPMNLSELGPLFPHPFA